MTTAIPVILKDTAGNYVLPQSYQIKATAETLGSVRVGSGLTISNNGILSTSDEAYTASEIETLWDTTTVNITLQFTLPQSQAQYARFVINGVDYCNGQTPFSITLPEGIYNVDSTTNCGYNSYMIYKLKLDFTQSQLQVDSLGWINITSPVSLTAGGGFN